MNRKLQDVQAGFRKGRRTRGQIANICWTMEKAREFQKSSISALLTMPKPVTLWITKNCGKFSSGRGTGKGQFSFQSQRKAMPKNAQTTPPLHSSHTLVKECSKFSKPGFSNT